MENNKPIIDESTTVIVAPALEERNPLILKRINKLIGQKSIQLAKDEALDESALINESDLDEILSKDEKRFYQIKRQAYLTSYPELAEDQFDLDDLHLLMMEQVHERQLLKKKKKHPSIDVSKERQDSIRRQQDLKKSLNIRRADRMKTKGERKNEISIAHLSLNFKDSGQMDDLNSEIIDMRKEEEMLKLKKGMIDA